MARQQDDLARLHRNLPRAAILDHVEDDVAAQLVEEFLVRVVVVVAALVRTADHLDDQVLGRRNTSRLPTGGFSRCACSSIQREKLNAPNFPPEATARF